MAIRIQLFDGSILEFPDNTSQEVIDRVAKQETLARQPAPQARPVFETPKKEGVMAAFGKGLESLLGSSKTAVGAFTGSPEEAALAGLERQKQSPYADQVSLEKVSEAYKRGLLPAAGEVARQVPLAIAEQAPNVLATLGSARLGAMAGAGLGSIVPGIGTAVGGIGGGILGAIAPSLLQQFGGNIQRQAQEQQERGQPIDISRTAAGLAAVPQAGLDVAASLIPLGRTFAGKVLGPQVEELLKRGSVEGAERLARESLPTVLGKGAAISIATEVPTEVIQTMLERSQAGLALTTPDALAEYGNVAYQAGLLAPIGAVGRVGERAAARNEALLPGQRRGESDMDFANRLSQEIGNDRAYVAMQQAEQAEAAKRQAALEEMKKAIGDGLLTPEVIKQWGFGKGSIFDSLVNKNLSNPEDASFVADVLSAYRSKAHPNTQVKIDDALAGIEAMFGAKPTPQTEGAADVGTAITEPSGAGVQVAGEPSAGAATPRLGAPEPAGVVPPVEDVGQPAGGAEAAPPAIALPAPPVEPPAPPKEGALQGSQTRLILPDGEKRPANWEVIEADSVSASLVEGQAQPRDRQRAASNAQVKSIANNPDFDRLSDTSQTMDYGAPTLTSDYVIVGGNGRFEGINLAYNTEAGQAYKQNLINNAERLGLDPAQVSGMKKPVLIRKLPADSAKPEETRKLAIQSNIVAGLEMSDMERAALDSERMTNLNELDITDTGDIPLTTKNMGTVRDALKGYTKEELSGMLAADGSLSQSGLRRVKNAVLYKAYGKTDTLSRLLESPDADLKNVGTALMRASGNMSRLMEGIKSGAIPADYDIIADLAGAVETLSALRATGTKVQDFINQAEMFEGGLSNEAKTILTFLDQNLRSAKSITEFLNDYASAAISAESAGDGLFGEVELPSKQETIERAAQRQEAERAAAKAQQTIFEQPAGAAVEEGAAKPEGEGRPAEGGEGEVAKPSLAAEAKPLPITPEIQEKIDQLEKVLKKIMNKFGLKDVALKLIDNMKAEGEYAQSVVRLALDAVNPVQALRHESIHALKELGFFSPQQWAVLEKQAKSKWIDQYLKTKNINKEELEEGQKSRYDAYMELYKGDMDAIIEEAIADAFGDFDVNKAPPGLMQAILTRLRNFFDAVKTAFGGEVTAEQVFRKVEKGALKAEAKAEAAPAKQSLRPETAKWTDEQIDEAVANGFSPVMARELRGQQSLFADLSQPVISSIGSYWKTSVSLESAVEAGSTRAQIAPLKAAETRAFKQARNALIQAKPELAGDPAKLNPYLANPGKDLGDYLDEAKPSLRELNPELKALGITEKALQQFLKYKAAERRVGSDLLYAKPADKAASTRAFRAFMEEMGGVDSTKARVALNKIDIAYMRRGEEGLFAPQEDLFGPEAKPSLRAPQTEAFKRWFGDSKVVDADGKPLVMYHGTGSDIDSFRGRGRFYFAEKPEYAASFAGKYLDEYRRPNIMPVYLSVQNPLDLTSLGGEFVSTDDIVSALKSAGANKTAQAVKDRQFEKYGRKQGVNVWELWFESPIREAVKDDGFDGVIQIEQAAKDESSMHESRAVMVFNPTQIKSATGNIGTFDATNPDIRYSLRDASWTPKRIDFLIEDQGYTDGKTKGFAAFIDPKDFVRATTSSKEQYQRIFDEAGPLREEDLRRPTEPPRLFISEDWKITGHEGRHRMAAMAASGVTRAPVFLKLLRGEQRSEHDFKTLSGQKFDDGSGSSVVVSDLTPLNYENRALLNERFGGEAKVKYSLRVNIPPSARARVVATTVTRQEKGFVERLMEAISPSTYSGFRAQALNRYNQLGVYDKIRAKKMGGAALLADSSAESAALLSDLGAGLTASALGVHDRMGGIPVFRNGITIISNQNGTIKGPTAIFAPLAADPSHYQAYQYWAGVKRGSRFLADGREHLFNDPNDKIEAEKIRKAFLKEGIDFNAIQKEWIKYNDGLVQYMVDTGVLSKDKADSFRKHGDYLPFYRQMDGKETVGPKVFQAISGVKAPKKLKGGEAMLDDFLEAIVRNTQAAIQAGVKNVAAQRAAKVAEDIGMASRLGFKSSAAGTFDVLENGQVVTYQAKDELFINAIKSLGIPDLPFIGLLSGPANLLRNLVTKDPGFMLANLMRDSMSAWVTSGVKMKPVVDTINNFGSAIAGKDPAFQALMNAGILGGYEFSQNVEQSGREFGKALRKQAKIKSTGLKGVAEMGAKPFTSLWDALEKGSTASDAATRMEVYKRTLAETNNEAEALFRALEVMNFNRKGSSAVVRILTAAVPFLNARMQGLDVLYRAASGQMNARDAAQIQKQFFVRGAMMASLSAAYWLLTHDDEEYKKQEQETRDNYWLLPSLGVKIPIPFEIGVLFKVIPERILGYTFGSDTGEDFLKSMARQLTSTLAFNPIPQAVMPVVETMTNFSFFTMRPIVGQGMEGLQPAYQVGPGTSRLAEGLGEMTKGMAKELQVSPMKIDQLISGYTGTMGMYLMNLMDAVYDMNTDSPKPSRRFEQMPLIRRFALDPEARGNVTAYYELKNSVDSIVRTSNMLERTMNYEELPGYLMDNMKMLASKDYILDLEKTMKEFREMKILIRAASMDADAKKDAILSIDQMENQLTSNIQYMKKLAKGD
jgi:hypothetical protein